MGNNVIQSVRTVAQVNANAIQDAYSTVINVGAATKDTTTTLAGNSNASSAITSDKNRGDSAASKTQLFCVTINKVASGFEAVDAAMFVTSGSMSASEADRIYQENRPKGADSFKPDAPNPFKRSGIQ